MKRGQSSSENTVKQLKLTGFFSSPRCTEVKISSTNMNDTQLGIQETTAATTPIQENSSTLKVMSSGKRKFQKAWLTELKWIRYDAASGLASCDTCATFPEISDQTSKVVKGFAEPFKLETFKKHAKSYLHSKCVAALEGKLNPTSRPLLKCMKKMDEDMLDHLKLVFNSSYYIAKNNKPFSDLKEILILVSKCDVKVSQQYNNRESCKEFVSHIASVIREDLILEIKQSSFVSFLLDASTDKSGEEQLIFYVRYLKNAKVIDAFLFIVQLENATADGYIMAIRNQLDKLGLLDLMSQSRLVGIGTDGAAAMIGSQNGFVAKMSKQDGMAHILGIHCVAHRLNLSVLSSVKNVKYLEEVDSLLVKIYKFYSYSPKRMRELRKVSEAFECQLIKFKYLHNVRWVACKVGALTALVKDWKCVVIHLEEISNGKGEEAATARGLLKKLKSFRFVVTIHFLLDFLNIFKNLSLIFQKEDLLLSTVDLHVKKAIYSLENLKKNEGIMTENVVSNTSIKGIFQGIQLNCIENKMFDSDKKNLLNDGIMYLTERFSTAGSAVALATSIFDTLSWPTGEKLQSFGETELNLLSFHFKDQLQLEEGDILGEWYEFKVLGQGLKLGELLE